MVLEFEILDYGEEGQDMLVYATEGNLPDGLHEILIELEDDTPSHIAWVTLKVGAALFLSEFCSDRFYTKGRFDIYD